MNKGQLLFVFYILCVMIGGISGYGAIARDVKEITKSGTLKILVTDTQHLPHLPRRVSPIEYEKALLKALAKKMHVKVQFIRVKSFDQLIPMLNAGKGDLIAANLTITSERLRKIKFSIPLTTVREQVIARAENRSINNINDLGNKTIVYTKGTSYKSSLVTLQKINKAIKIVAAKSTVDTEELIYQVAEGKIDTTIADSNFIEDFQSYYPEIKVVYTLPCKKYIAWGMRSNSVYLKKVVDTFLRNELKKYSGDTFLDDFDDIKKRRVLRVITTNNPLDYFMHRGRLMGFEYELVKKFADDYGLQLVMIVPPAWNDLFTYLLHGKGDIIASSVTITDKRKHMTGLTFCRPYGNIVEMVVARKDEQKIKRLSDLAGRTIVVRKGSSYWGTLEKIRDQYGFKLQAAPAHYEEYRILEEVARGGYDLTVVDDQILKAELTKRRDIKALFAIGKPRQYGWLVRSGDRQLRDAVNQYFKKVYKGVFYNVLYKKYYNSSRIEKSLVKKAIKNSEISPYDPIIKKYSSIYSFPWCLIAAQVYQESRFNPNAKSYMGTVGLMQLMPSTAAEVGFKYNYMKPDNNIHAGVKYMAKLRKRFDEKDDMNNKLCFGLASYNGGYGHIRDAIRLAERLNYDPERWFNSVEKAIALLSEPKYARQARYGCCRSNEIIDYVRDIMHRYQSYQQLLKKDK